MAPDHLGCGLSDKPQRLLAAGRSHRQSCRARRAAAARARDARRPGLGRRDWAWARCCECASGCERIVLFNTGAFPPRYIPWRIRACRIADRWPAGRARCESVQPGGAADDAARRNGGSSRPSRPDIWRRTTRGRIAGPCTDLCATYRRRERCGPWTGSYRVWISNQRRAGSPRSNASCRRSPIVPACLIWGMRDWCFRPDCLERFVAAWPRAEVHRLADVGHWVVEDAPDESLAHRRAIPGAQTKRDRSPRHRCRRMNQHEQAMQPESSAAALPPRWRVCAR